jgi:hypothetical protein
MKIKIIKLLSGIVAACAALPLLADTTAPVNPPQDFPQAVQFELGVSDFAPGDSITINEVRGTADAIRPGETYCVTGTYTLNSQEAADLSFFETVSNSGSTPVDPLQTVQVVKGTRPFRLIKHVTDDGFLHVTFYSQANGQGFGGVYFGQGEWVLRHKFSHRRDFVSHENREPVTATGPNQALFDYLGNPVVAPENLDASYTKAGLIRGMQDAAKNAGVSLVKLEIDDSEFPFLVGVVVAGPGDWEKLKEQIRRDPAYEFNGGVGGDTTYAMNLVPSGSYPPGTHQRIYHRLMLRTALLSDKIKEVK